MNIEADLHIHTVASGHAYSTVEEITKEAARKGLKLVGLTDHGPALPGGAHRYHFWNLRIMPVKLNGVKILRGIEANIIDAKGNLDLPEDYLEPLDLVLAGFHPHSGYDSGSIVRNTDTLIMAMENPLVDIIAHPGNAKFPIDPEALTIASLELGVALELNNSSFLTTSSRPNAHDFDLRTAEFVAQDGSLIVLSSDAHIYTQVGEVSEAALIAKKAGIKETQVVNATIESVYQYLSKRRLARQ